MGLSTPRTLRFRLSKALAENQHWAVTSFPAIVQRATGHSERWAFVDHATDPDGLHEWRYEVQGIPEVDIVVDHIIHELTDSVLLDEWHSITEDRFTFGSMHRDRPIPPADAESRHAEASPEEDLPQSI